MVHRTLQGGEEYRIVDGKRRLWWTCAECGCDLGPAASKERMMPAFSYPSAYDSADGTAVVCYACWCKEHGYKPLPIWATMQNEEVIA